jgi:diacylglycerol kinase (ATP)
MRSKVIVNPTSGPWDVRHEIPSVIRHLEDQGWQTDLHYTARAGEATELAQEAQREGLDAVFVVGGDGTTNEVINGLANSAVALAVLPGGTGNVWAKEQKANGRYFLQWTGLGLDAEVTYAMEPRTRRQRRLGVLAYVVAGVTTAATMAGVRTRLCIDGELVYRRAWTMAFWTWPCLLAVDLSRR